MPAPQPARPDAAAALTAATVLGGFFRADPAPGPDWTTWAALLAEAGRLDRRMAEIGAMLAAGPSDAAAEPAVVASLAHLGLVARLLSSPLGAALLTGVLPVAPPERVHLRPAGANPIPLALQAPRAVAVAAGPELAAALHRHWLAPAVEPLTSSVRAAAGVSLKVLNGNVISALASGLALAAAARPELTGAATATLDALLRAGPLAGTGRRRDDRSFVRRSCCLFYRLPGAGTCADCVLADRSPTGGR